MFNAGTIAAAAQPWTPDLLFKKGEQGVWYDPSDIERYMTKGPELVTNGDFATDIAGWTPALSAVLEYVGGALKVTGGGPASGAVSGFPTTPGQTYQVVLDVVGFNSPAQAQHVRISDSGVSHVNLRSFQFTAIGRVVGTFVASAATSYVWLTAQFAGNTVTYDNVSIRELTAINTATMFQDALGTLPVTAVEQPVGLILDKRFGLARGPEVWSGPFITNGAASESGGVVTFAAAASSAYVRTPASASATVGKTYEFTFRVASMTEGSIRAYIGSTNTVLTVTAPGTYKAISALTGAEYIQFLTIGVSNTAVIDNISARELPGNHASQSTTTARPVLSARVNSIENSYDFNSLPWSRTNTTLVGGYLAPDGTLTAQRMIEGTTTAFFRIFAPSSRIPVITGEKITRSIYAKAGSRGYLRITGSTTVLGTSVTASYDLNNGTADVGGAGEVAMTHVGDGWYRCSLSMTVTGTGTTGSVFEVMHLDPQDGNSITYQGDGEGYIYLWGAQVESGLVATRYQHSTSATDYDWQGWPLYLRFDGVDDYLVAASPYILAADSDWTFGSAEVHPSAALPTFGGENGNVFVQSGIANNHSRISVRTNVTPDAQWAKLPEDVTNPHCWIIRSRADGLYNGTPLPIRSEPGSWSPFHGDFTLIGKRGGYLRDSPIYGVIAINRSITDSQMAAVGNLFSGKYKVPA